MLSARFKPWHVPLFIGKYAWLVARRRPILVHFEVTLRCNARCDFCDYWKTDPRARDLEVRSFADAARFFRPLLVTFTGGEPTLRPDLEDLVRAVVAEVRLKYVMLITHGARLDVTRALSLWQAGINQFNISLDYLDERHDRARGIPGLADRILRTVPQLRAVGIDGVRFNTVIKRDNVPEIMPIVHRAKELGCGVNLSVYTDAKNGNRAHLLPPEELGDVERLCRELLAFKDRNRGVITNSDYYVAQIPRYLRGEMREPCRSGVRTIHLDPSGHVKRCPDFPVDFHWSEYRRYKPIACNACYYACRGEAQAPLQLSRVRDVMA
ncbi:MAG TPA: radical SAM protein [Gemmatimonadaceae bacterium]|nr:radical SAM protein [Gemmatimonadaceae bacterium]